jgi:hypothetical protein
MSLSLHDVVYFSLITSLKPNLRTALTTQNTTEKNCTISHAPETTALQPNVILVGIRRLLVTKKGQSPSSVQTTAKANCIFHIHYLCVASKRKYLTKHKIAIFDEALVSMVWRAVQQWISVFNDRLWDIHSSKDVDFIARLKWPLFLWELWTTLH